MKKIFFKKYKLFLYIVSVVFGLIFLTKDVYAEQSYNATNALEYAKAHWDDGKGKCAEFVSDVLKAGGITSAWSTGCTTLRSQLLKTELGNEYEIPLQSDKSIKMRDYREKMSAGDIVFYYCPGCVNIDGKPYIHAVVCNGEDSNGYMKAYSHNNSNNGTKKYCYSSSCYTCGTTIKKAYVYHFNVASTARYITFSSNSLVVNEGESATVNISFSGDNIYSLSTDGNGNIASLEWGDTDWSRGTSSIKITGRSAGKTEWAIRQMNNSNEILYEKKISVEVQAVNKPMETGAGYTVPNGDYQIITNLNRNMTLDVSGDTLSLQNGDNILIWTGLNRPCDIFTLIYLNDGFYKIGLKGTDLCLDARNSGKTNGTNVGLWQYVGAENQKWSISDNGDGTFRIQSKCNGLSLDIYDGKANDGQNVQMWSNNDTDAQKWRFGGVALNEGAGKTIEDGDYYLATWLNRNMTLDIPGDSSNVKSGANAEIYEGNNDVFHVQYLNNGFYKIIHKDSKLCLDVYNANPDIKSNVQCYTDNGSIAQQWSIINLGNGKYQVNSRCNGLMLDVQGGKANNSQNVWVYPNNDSTAQIWEFISSDNGQAIGSGENPAEIERIEKEDTEKNVHENQNVVDGTVTSNSDIKTIKIGATINDSINETGQENSYMFSITQSGRVTLDITSYMEYYTIEIFDSNSSKRLWYTEHNGYNESLGFRSDKYEIDLDKGSYYVTITGCISVNRAVPTTGSYIIKSVFQSFNENIIEPNNDFSTAQNIKIGDVANGAITLNDASDNFSFVLNQAGKVCLQMKSYMKYYTIEVFNSSAKLVWYTEYKPFNESMGYRVDDYSIDLGQGNYYATVTGCYSTNRAVPTTGKYNLSVTMAKDISEANFSKPEKRVFDGREYEPLITVVYQGITLIKDVDYTVSYENNYNVGTASAVITGKGKYYGSKTIFFSIVSKQKGVGKGNAYVNIHKSKITKLKKDKKAFGAKWKKVSGIEGYELQYSLKKNFKSAKTKNLSGKKTSVTVKNLKSKKKYYVRIRTYKMINGAKKYSGWSKVKTVLTK